MLQNKYNEMVVTDSYFLLKHAHIVVIISLILMTSGVE